MRVLLDTNVILDALLQRPPWHVDADALPGNDLEDNILVAASVTASLDAIVTCHAPDFAHSPVLVLEPAELVKRLARGSSPPTSAAKRP